MLNVPFEVDPTAEPGSTVEWGGVLELTLPDGAHRFIEVHVACALEVCEERDPKGLYEKARSGEIPNFTGISAPYEAPASPEISVRTDEHSVDACVEQLVDYLERNGYFTAEREPVASRR